MGESGGGRLDALGPWRRLSPSTSSAYCMESAPEGCALDSCNSFHTHLVVDLCSNLQYFDIVSGTTFCLHFSVQFDNLNIAFGKILSCSDGFTLEAHCTIRR